MDLFPHQQPNKDDRATTPTPDMTVRQALVVLAASAALVIVGPWLGPIGVLAVIAAVTGGSFAVRDLAAHRRRHRAGHDSHATA